MSSLGPKKFIVKSEIEVSARAMKLKILPFVSTVLFRKTEMTELSLEIPAPMIKGLNRGQQKSDCLLLP